ncbi:MAG: carbohydrate ABC transporter permease [Candidatus Merdivicinus sp.]
MANNKVKRSKADHLFYIIDYILLALLSVVILVPIINVIAQSVSSPNMVVGGRVFLLPKEFSVQAYRSLLKNSAIVTGYLNTLIYMVSGTLINLVMTVICAYPLARRELVGRNAVMAIFTFTMLFNGGMIPNYMLMKDLHLLDTRWVMIIPGAISVWNMIMARTFFQTSIPSTLYESANLDGAGDFRVLWSIVLPLSKPIIAVLSLFYAVGHWNSYFNAMLYLKSTKLFNIQLVLRNALNDIGTMMDTTGNVTEQLNAIAAQEVSKYAMIVITMIPVLIIYPFVQKFFVKGVMIGSIKG